MPKKEPVKASSRDRLQFIVVAIENEFYAIDIHYVAEVTRLADINRERNLAPYEGTVTLGGKAINAIDLRKRFGVTPREYNRNTRVIVVEIDQRTIGLIVDSVSEVLRIPPSAVNSKVDTTTIIDPKYIQGVAKIDEDRFFILDLPKALNVEEMAGVTG